VGILTGLSLIPCVCLYCDKTADCIRMPFGVVSGIDRGIGVLDEVEIVECEGQFWW